MSELSVEEKAKRFDEALNIAKFNYDVVIQSDKECSFARDAVVNTFHHMFPELKESEDVKMLQEIKRYVKEQGDKPTGLPNGSISVADMLAWLEKQGETDKVSYEIAEKEKREFTGDGFIKCLADFQDFREGESYWLEYTGNDNYNVRSDNLLGRTYHITPCELYTVFRKQTSWKPSKEEMDVLYGLAYITNRYDEQKEEVLTRLYQDLKREFFNGSSYENMFPNTEDGVRRRSTIQVLEYARSLDNYNEYGKADIDKNIAWLEKHGNREEINEVSYRMGIQRVLDNPESYGLEKQYEQPIYKTPSRETILAIWDLGNEWKELTGGSISTEYGTQLEYIQKHWEESEYYLRAKQNEQKSDMGISSTTKQKLRDSLNRALEQETTESWNEFLDEQGPADKIQIGKKYKCVASPRYTVFMTGDIYKPEDEFLCSLMNFCSDCFEPVKDDEQEPVGYVEPKFRVGDLVVTSYGKVNQVVSVDKDGDGYTLDDDVYFSGSWCNMYHLWTIQDAKDGDVLAAEPIEGTQSSFIALYKKQNGEDFDSYCFVGFDGKFYKNEIEHPTDGIHPATKEQRETLMRAIGDAGYEWNAEKKELEKIEEKSAWSEEDEKMLTQVIYEIEAIKSNSSTVFEKNIAQDKIDWLKALKDRVHKLSENH